MSTPPDVGLSSQGVGGPDRILYALWRPRRRKRNPIPQNGPTPRHHRPVSPLLDVPAFLFLLLILILFRPLPLRRRRLRFFGQRESRPNRPRIRFVICRRNLFRSAGRPRLQSARRIVSYLDRGDRGSGQNSWDVMHDRIGRRVGN